MSMFEVLDSYAQLRREIGLLWAVEIKSLDLGPKQVLILYRLSESSATMGELNDYTLSDKAATTRTVASLESLGLVKRVGLDGDKRVTIVELTAKGRLKASRAVEIREYIGRQINETLNVNERKQITEILSKVAGGLRDIRTNTKSK